MLESYIKDKPSLFWTSKNIAAYVPFVFKKPVKNILSKDFDIPFLLVLGSGRSGNTLLRRLLMEKLSIYIPPETYVLPKISEFRISARYLDWNAIVDLCLSSYEYHPEFETFRFSNLRDFALEAKSWNSKDRTIQNLVRQLYLWFAKQSELQFSWVGDKTPINTLHIRNIEKIIPNAKYIYLVRDGVDVSVSYVKAGIYDNLNDAARRWVRSHKSWDRFKSSLPKSSYLEIRYEDLVRSSSDIIQNIAKQLDIPIRDNLIDVNDELGDATMRNHHANSLSKPTTKSIGKGRDSLTDSQRLNISPILNPVLTRLGYEKV